MGSTCLYYITDRRAFPGSDSVQKEQLLQKISGAARCGVDYIQLREKDLPAGELETLTASAMQAVSSHAIVGGGQRGRTRLLVNSRLDIAIAAGADGVHLRANDLKVQECREIVKQHNPGFLVAVSCHNDEEVARASTEGADFVVFGPVFEKRDYPAVAPAGLTQLRKACQHGIPALALGGVNLENAQSCLDAGAAGIAAIRLFQNGEMVEVVRRLRQ